MNRSDSSSVYAGTGFLASALALLVVSGLAPTGVALLLAAVCGAVALPSAARSETLLPALFAIAIFFDAGASGDAAKMSPGKAAGVALIGGAIFKVLAGHKVTLGRVAPILISCLGLGVAVGASGYANHGGEIASPVLTWVLFRVAVVAALVVLTRSHYGLSIVLRSFAIGGLIACSVAVAQAILGVAPIFPEASNEYLARAVGTLRDPNVLASFAIPAAAVAWGLCEGGLLSRRRAGTQLCITAVAMLVAQSRSGLLGLGLLAMYAVFRGGRASRRIALTCVIGTLLAIPALSLWHRSDAGSNNSVEIRSELRAEAVRLFEEQPILGVGPGEFRLKNRVIDLPAHNGPLEIASELGLIGLAAAIALYAGCFAAVRGEDVPRGIRLAIGSALATSLWFAMSISTQYSLSVWFLVGAAAVTASLKESASATREEHGVATAGV